MRIADLEKKLKNSSVNIKDFIKNGGYLYLDRSFNICVSKTKPSKDKMIINAFHKQDRKEKMYKKTQAVQKQLEAYGVALKTDIENLQKQLNKLKKSTRGSGH